MELRTVPPSLPPAWGTGEPPSKCQETRVVSLLKSTPRTGFHLTETPIGKVSKPQDALREMHRSRTNGLAKLLPGGL